MNIAGDSSGPVSPAQSSGLMHPLLGSAAKILGPVEKQQTGESKGTCQFRVSSICAAEL